MTIHYRWRPCVCRRIVNRRAKLTLYGQKFYPETQSIRQIKLDGHIEACIQAAQIYDIGLSDVVDLMLLAALREFQARKYDRSTVTAVV